VNRYYSETINAVCIALFDVRDAAGRVLCTANSASEADRAGRALSVDGRTVRTVGGWPERSTEYLNGIPVRSQPRPG